MHFLPDDWPLWIGGALALFWFVGAHNRLMRLRTAALQAWAALDAALLRQLDYVQAQAPPAGASGQQLQAAIGQLATMLAATRLHPLDPQAMGAVGTALQAMLAAWERLHPDTGTSFSADGTLSRPAPLGGRIEAVAAAQPAAAPLAWPEPSAAAEIARGQFQLAVRYYNEAIGQFPAFLVAWVFRLHRAAPLLG